MNKKSVIVVFVMMAVRYKMSIKERENDAIICLRYSMRCVLIEILALM